ncbi:tumor necrosis factor receptor superfamily member 8 isoform X4 [Tachysurus fulvidraco]|uniref:tumor necrosis factor receptor superfamily member 8 isoform X4 n=1 Tax=Tachysurus fulvidraco TaxID=1234273 RepID=UPI001FF02736|nr:tumor necrosis factor receptor superfamily member 8 isoform X4 [Tachysurus fulvidraco]
MMLILWGGFLLIHFFCHVHPQECDTYRQYPYTRDGFKCCMKCEPGQRMEKGCTKESETVCKPCSPDFYMDECSREMECKRCTQCTKENMVYKVNCSKISNAVCGCERGYQCSGNSCTDCEKIPEPTTPTTTSPTTTTPTTTTPTTTTPTVTSSTKKPQQTLSQDIVWITLSLCCVCILLTCFILISRTTPAYGWIMLATAGCFWRSEKTSIESSQCTVDEEVPMPVQEMCGHKDWQEEV